MWLSSCPESTLFRSHNPTYSMAFSMKMMQHYIFIDFSSSKYSQNVFKP